MEVETVVVALVGGAVGAIVTAVLRIRHEREERYRERLLDAADDFSTGVIQAMRVIRDARRVPALGLKAHELVDVAHDRQARVRLLFGGSTAAGHAAADLVSALNRASTTLDSGSVDDVNLVLLELWDLHDLFNDAALRVARRAYLPVRLWRLRRDSLELSAYSRRRDQYRRRLEEGRDELARWIRAADP